MNYLAIGLIIILIIVIYYVYYYLTNTALTSGLQELNKPIEVKYEKLKNPTALTYSYQCWLYISSPTAGAVSLFGRQNISPKGTNEFAVDLSGQTLLLKAGQGVEIPNVIMTITNSFPVQKWTHLVINVHNMKTFEAYLNGKLAKTVNVSNVNSVTPSSRLSSLKIGNSSVSGYVSKFIRLPVALDAKTVWTNYLEGNGLSSYFSSLIPYGLNMSISKGEDIQRIVKLV
jgi:hypothetical protein